MKRRALPPGWAVWFVAIGVLGPLVSAADSSEPEADTWTFETTVDARLRYEAVDDDAVPDRANALTLRTRLSFAATRSRLYGVLVEFEDVRAIGSERFNSTANGRTNFAVVADPESTELNRAWLRFAARHEIVFKLGRQRVNHDRGRIIGDVGWRQNQQTFDGGPIYVIPEPCRREAPIVPPGGRRIDSTRTRKE